MTRLMRQAGLEGRCKKRWRKTTVADPGRRGGPRSDSAPLRARAQTWTGAMSATSPTSRPGRAGAYLATVIDLASRRVVGWALADHMRTELVEDALTMAFEQPCTTSGASFFIRTGAVKYLSIRYSERLDENDIVASVGSRGDSYDSQRHGRSLQQALKVGADLPPRAVAGS